MLPIPASKIRGYAARIGYVGEEDNDYFYTMIRELDLAYCRHLNAKFDAERKKLDGDS